MSTDESWHRKDFVTRLAPKTRTAIESYAKVVLGVALIEVAVALTAAADDGDFALLLGRFALWLAVIVAIIGVVVENIDQPSKEI